ncbi:hypothetical protein GHT06_020227 [Daphnia sinensis]|uniref:Reverse transcriptase domain-containing protein n=1 Tax=Daphnia sinensis TaxID=1820382 RepID=A0AAD5KMB0_9CRUS|nr:hypothetical protein GHT06_020227 [Daphnia sinensis]
MGAAIVGGDFEKAYDLVNKEVLWRILDVMSYSSIFVRWLQTMYFVTEMSILNGRFTRDAPYMPISSFYTLSHYLCVYLEF